MLTVYTDCPDGQDRALYYGVVDGVVEELSLVEGDWPEAEFTITAGYETFARISRAFMNGPFIDECVTPLIVGILVGMGIQIAEFIGYLKISPARVRQVDIPEMPGSQIPSQQHLQNWPGIIAGRSPINLLVFGNVLRDRNCATP